MEETILLLVEMALSNWRKFFVFVFFLSICRAALGFEHIAFKQERLEAFVVREVFGSKVEWHVLTPVSNAGYPHSGTSLAFLTEHARTDVAINANFYREDQPELQKPIGLVVSQGEILSEPHANWPSVGKGSFGWIWDQVSMKSKVELFDANGKRIFSIRVCRFNANPSFGCAALWFNGKAVSAFRKTKLKVLIETNRPGLKTGVSEFGVSDGEKPYWVLELPQNVSQKPLGKIKRAKFETSLVGTREGEKWNSVLEAVSGSHVFAEEGTFPPEKRSRPWAGQKQPRSVIGQDSSGRMLLAAFDGRRAESEGVSVEEAWAILRKKLDAKWMLNLDGGGSTALILKKQLLNKPSNGVPRKIAVGLGAKISQ